MIVIQTKDFQKVYSRHVQVGGTQGRMAQKAATVITNLTNGLPAGVATSNNGETRLRNCVKYALNESYRLVTVQDGDRCFVLHMGVHDNCDEWLVQHRNMQVVFDATTHAVALVAAVKGAKPEDLVPQGVQHADTPLLRQVEGVNWEEVISSPAHRFMLMGLTEAAGERIWETIAFVQQENPALADLVVTVINHIRKGQLIEAGSAVARYTGKALADAPPNEVPAGAIEEALRNPVNRERFIVLNDLTPDELKLVLDPKRFQEWMVFLHKGQQRVVEEDFEKPAILTGVSGSGKTCVLVHRAKRLVRETPGEKALILTLNRSLAKLIENLVSQVCSSDEAARINVMSFHDYLEGLIEALDLETFLNTLGKCTGHTPAITRLLESIPPNRLRHVFKALDERALFSKFGDFLNDANHNGSDDAVRLWNFLSTTGDGVDPVHYLYEEMELVRSAFPAYDDYHDYLNDYERPGRSVAFQKNRREQVLAMLHAWEHHQLSKGFLDHMGLSQAAAVAVDDKGGISRLYRYRFVLVDEFQDFSTLDLNLLTRIPTGEKNGLFLTGDVAQKIYAKELNFAKAGLGTDARVVRSIRKNYRNSKQILRAADNLIRAFPPPQDSDTDLKVLDPELASHESAMPIAVKSTDPLREAWRQASEWLAAGNPGFSVCIATANPDKLPLEDIISAKPPDIVAVKLSGDYLLNPTEVVVSDTGTIKGFEFSLIMVVGLEEGVFPYEKRPPAEYWRDAMRLYVAITRGRDEVRFPYKGEPSRFIVAMGESILWQEALPFEAPSEQPKLTALPDPVDTPAAEEHEEKEQPSPIPPPKVGTSPDVPPQIVTRPDELEISKPVSTPAISAGSTPAPKIDAPDIPAPPTKATPDTQSAPTRPTTPIRLPLPVPTEAPERTVSRPKFTYLNGYACVSLPRGLSQRQLTTMFGWDDVEVSLALQNVGIFLTPVSPIPDHAVREILKKRGMLANFYGEQM